MSEEEWKPVPADGFEHLYEVSTKGRIRRTKNGFVLKGIRSSGPTGHLYVVLMDSPKRRNVNIHRMVALAFLGTPAPGLECCHNDGDAMNNTVENLRWDTHKANAQDALRHGQLKVAPKKTVCKWGHPFTEENTGRDRGGYKVCRACMRQAQRAQRARKESNV